MTAKAEWLLWDVEDLCWWYYAGDGTYARTFSRSGAARFTLAEARKWAEDVNDVGNDPLVALVPDMTPPREGRE